MNKNDTIIYYKLNSLKLCQRTGNWQHFKIIYEKKFNPFTGRQHRRNTEICYHCGHINEIMEKSTLLIY